MTVLIPNKIDISKNRGQFIMCKWFKEMECYVLAGRENRSSYKLSHFDKRAKLEQSFRNYAAVFDKVKLVINKNQAKEEFLNFPHICDEADSRQDVVSIAQALKNANSEAIFIGSSEIYDFPLSLLSNLIKAYNGESFLGYTISNAKDQTQLLFGIYNKKLSDKFSDKQIEKLNLNEILDDNYKLLTFPKEIDSSCIGL